LKPRATPEILKRLDSLRRLADPANHGSDGEVQAARAAIKRILDRYEINDYEEPSPRSKASSPPPRPSTSKDVATYRVHCVTYSVHHKRGAGVNSPRTMRVGYQIGPRKWQYEWICFEHKGFARRKAEEWWNRRSPTRVPATTNDAVNLANSGALREPESITVRFGDPFDTIIDYRLRSSRCA
jgi:hypothetical protein